MKKHIYTKKGKKHVVFAEIEEKQIESKLRKLEKEQGVKVEANGYPTLFRIEGGKVDYYQGTRQSDAMSQWYLSGGDPDGQMPGMLQDQQGGHRYRRTFKKHRKMRYPKQYKGTRKHFEKKQPGILEYIFGK